MKPEMCIDTSDVGGETARYLLHKLSNMLHIIYLCESEVDVSAMEKVLDFGRAVYCNGDGGEKILKDFNVPVAGSAATGLCAVLWRLYEKKKCKTIQCVRADRVDCCTKNLNLFDFPPIKYAADRGYGFTIDLEGISISSPHEAAKSKRLWLGR
jgi:hypothetical protein